MLARPLTLEHPSDSLDTILTEICESLQLTPTQQQRAERAYRSVGGWLAQPDSCLAPFEPALYPQGSMALGTTVRPRGRVEHDVDLVMEVERFLDGPLALYNLTVRRLREHGEYRERLELKRRCVRLVYTDEFHLDVLPGRHDLVRGGTCIEVPDRELHDWSPSNPRGYRLWFEHRCLGYPFLSAAAQEPLPPEETAAEMPALKRIVQLMKRRRDVVFDGSDLAPRSIVLTTLAAEHQAGDMSGVSSGLDHVLDLISRAIAANWPRPLVVCNSSNPPERFSEAWEQDRRLYTAFVEFVADFQRRWKEVLAARGMEEIAERLKELFGERVAVTAVERFADRVRETREAGRLRATSGGLSTTAGVIVPKHNFYGR